MALGPVDRLVLAALAVAAVAGPAPLVRGTSIGLAVALVGARRERLRAIDAWMPLAIAVSLTTVRIEWLNHEAGTYLPRGGFEAGSRWRVAGSHGQHERSWRHDLHWRDPGSQSRELTTSEREELDRYVRRNLARDDLRGLIESWGLAQYVLVPLLAAIAIGLATQARPGLGAACGSIAVAAASSMYYRAYYSSLGC